MPMTGSLESTTVNISPRWRPKSRSNQLICYIDVTGFASVMFALLLMFWVIRVYDHWRHGVPVDFPKVNHAKALRHADAEDALMIGVSRDDKVFFRRDLVAPQKLPVLIADAVRHGAENKVYIHADPGARYAWVKEVLDAARESGVEDVAFITNPRPSYIR